MLLPAKSPRFRTREIAPPLARSTRRADSDIAAFS
jgi:hypothetical protein